MNKITLKPPVEVVHLAVVVNGQFIGILDDKLASGRDEIKRIRPLCGIELRPPTAEEFGKENTRTNIPARRIEAMNRKWNTAKKINKIRRVLRQERE